MWSCAFCLQLEHVLCGSKEIGDLSELRKNTKYRGSYTDESPVIQWFWVSPHDPALHAEVCHPT